MSRIVFLDTQTTGLDPFTEDVFEVAIVEQSGKEHVFRLRPRQGVLNRMHPKAAEVNRYHDRTAATVTGWEWDDTDAALALIRNLLDGAHICGAVPDFDTRFLTETYKRAVVDPPRWHYHLIDIEAMAVGYCHGKAAGINEMSVSPGAAAGVPLPWDSDKLSRAIGVEPPTDEDRHTALGDARWVKRLYDAMTGGAA